jgi:Leucine-rich repeat (LRR) protein
MPERDVFLVDDVELRFADASRIGFGDGKMQVHLIATSAPHERRPDLFSIQHYSEPEVRVSDLAFPTPECRIVRRCERFGGPRLWTDGLAGSLQFQGEIRVEDSWFSMEGFLHGNYGSDPAGPRFRIHKRFEPGPIDPTQFAHDNLEFALSIDPLFVGELSFDWNWKTLPPEFFRMKNLRRLSLSRVEFDDARDRFDELVSLQRLSLRAVRTIPAGIFGLPALDHLGIEEGEMEGLPAAVADLRSMRSISVTRSKLRTVPSELFCLPRLEIVDLQWNKLESLPDTSAAPHLRVVDLKGNAFKSLPASLASIEKVGIEAKHRGLYKDAAYKPKKRTAIDHAAYSAASDPAFVATLDEALRRHDLVRYRESLLALSRSGVRFTTTTPDDYTACGNTRFGGDPDLPPAFEYPVSDGQHWIFIAQIDLAELAAYQSYLPRAGLLTFLVNDLEYSREVMVLHHRPRTKLRRRPLPVDAVQDAAPFRGFRASVERAYSLPFLYREDARLAVERQDLLDLRGDGTRADAYAALRADLCGERGPQENDRHGINVHVFTQNESPEEQAAERSGGQPEEWVVLLTAGFDKNTGYCFWDAGTLTFSIHKADLAIGDFSRVVASIESS